MQLFSSLEECDKISEPVVLTIGNFDGLHLGHRALLEFLVKTAKDKLAKTCVLTFSNHPSTVLRPENSTPLLCSTEHKIKLLKETSIDFAIFSPFTKSLSEQSVDFFLEQVKKALDIKMLILGSDAHIGNNRKGNSTVVTALSMNLGFIVEYFSDYLKNGQRVSSSLIRNFIQYGQLKEAELLLGRPYSIYGQVLPGKGRGASLGFPTANICVEGLCLPPFGVYAVTLFSDEKPLKGVANLGLAPTMREGREVILEVYLFDQQMDLYGLFVDVRFHNFIRQEKRFNHIEELKQQIFEDVIIAKQMHKKLEVMTT